MNYLKILTFLITVIISLSGCTMNEPHLNDQLIRFPYKSKYDGADKEAFVYLPRGYSSESGKKWPLILFLHGNGERGNGKSDLDFVMMHGPLYEAWIQKKDLPFIIIAPQLDMMGKELESDYLRERDRSSIPKRLENSVPDRIRAAEQEFPMEASGPGKNLEYEVLDRGWEKRVDDVLLILDNVLKEYNADPSRIYLTGLSYGGFGTWYIASRHPKLFAAIAPVAGWGHFDFMKPIASEKVPVWAFAGGRDKVIEKEYFYKGLNYLEELGHKEIRFTIHEDMGHDVWKRVYAGDDIYKWFLAQSRSTFEEKGSE